MPACVCQIPNGSKTLAMKAIPIRRATNGSKTATATAYNRRHRCPTEVQEMKANRNCQYKQPSPPLSNRSARKESKPQLPLHTTNRRHRCRNLFFPHTLHPVASGNDCAWDLILYHVRCVGLVCGVVCCCMMYDA